MASNDFKHRLLFSILHNSQCSSSSKVMNLQIYPHMRDRISQVLSPPPLLNRVSLPSCQTVNTLCSFPPMRACFSAAFSLSVSDGAAGKRQLSLYIRVWVYSCKNDSNSLHSWSVWGFSFLWFCKYQRAVGPCGCWSCCYGVHDLSTM